MKKQPLKNRLVFLLKNDVIKFNRYMRFSLSIKWNFECNLKYANLEFANLESANLKSANLKFANLESANMKSANLESANLESANMKSANLKSANLESANLEFANLKSANLESANLEFANLKSANLKFANLKLANLEFANLESANLDMSCFPLWCGSLKMKTDIKIRTQIAFHFASLISSCDNSTDEEKQIYANILEYVNKFHRQGVERLKVLENEQ